MAQTLPNTAHTAHISTTPHSSHSDSHSIIHPHIHLEPPPPSQVNDLPAVERYPLLRALPPAMPSFDVSSPAPTPSRSTTLDQSDTDFEIDFSSSDDEAGVFFGTPKPVESKILAALSKSISSTPLTRERPPAPRRSSARLPKRDSREFLRRKTLLLSTPGAGPASEKMWEGGFVERPEDVDDEPLPGPSTPMVGHEDIAVDLDTVQLDTFPSSPEVTYLDAFFNEEEEDKENSAVPEEWDGDQEYDSEDAYVPAPPEGVPMSLGFCDGQYDLDMSPGLDMGGLSLLDIDDPEEMPFEFGNETGGAGLRVFLGASTSSSGSSIASASGAFSLHPHTLSPFRRRRRHSQSSGAGDLAHENLVSEGTSDREDEGADEVLDRPDVPILEETTVDSVPAVIGSDPAPSDRSEAANLDMESTGAQETPELEASILDGSFSSHEDLADGSCSHSSPNHPRAHSPFESLDMFSALAKAPSSAAKAPTFLDTTADLIAFTPLKPNGRTHLEVDSDSSYVSEVDSPRAPIMIPVFTVASPPRQRLARDPEPMLVDDIAPLDDDLGSAVALPTLDGPFGLVLSPFSRAPAANTTPGKSPSRLPVLSPVQSAKAQKTLARTAAAKEHLENLFSSKLGKSRLGESSSKVQPPVKRALVTSRLPSKATIQSPQVFTKSKEEPTARTRIPSPEAPSKGKGKAPEKPLKSILKSTSKVTQPKPFALSAPRQKVSVKLSAPGQSGLPRPTAAVASSLPRPVSKRPDPQVSTSTDASSTSKLFRITPKMPVARPVEAGSSVKRPPTANGMAMARVMAPVGPSMASASRSALGLPARLARDQSGDSAAFASSMSTGSSSGVLFHPPAKSPGRMMSPPKPVLGKPQRATGMTPISSRMMATPQRGVPTPSKVFKLGTPSRPAATPLRHRTRMMPVSEERRLSCTPIRGEEPPTPLRVTHPRMEVDEPPATMDPVVQPPESDMPAHARARIMASPLPTKSDAPPSPPVQGTATLSPEGGESAENAPPSDNEGASPTADAPQSSGENSPDASATSPPPPDNSLKDAEGSQDTAQEAEADPPETRRSKRTRSAPPSQSQESPSKKAKTAAAESIVPGLTERALRSATTRNTARNQVYLCTIDRKIVRKPGERPPSPSPGVRTISERDAEEQKEGRNARAKRRARASVGESEDEGAAGDDEPSIERAVLGRRGPGDDEEYKTPARPAKRARTKNGLSNDDGSKRVRWDEGLLIIRRGLGDVKHSRRPPPRRSCVTPRARYELDEHGNAVNRPTEKLKRTTITVHATFYDGEEPVAFNYNKPASGKRRGKK